MRVISGIARGKRLKTLEGMDVRPTTDKVKEAIFSSIQFGLPGAVVLDLFAGSGQLGIEALSRGAERAYFVDQSPKSLAVVKENIANTDFTAQATVVQSEANLFLKTNSQQKWDFVFLDPPYRKDLLLPLLTLLEERLQPEGRIICEHEKELTLPETVGTLQMKKRYGYGSIAVTVYVSAGEAAEQ